jgi:hypothetical protein
MKVISKIKTYPDSGEESKQPKEIEVRSHWTFTDRVILVIGEQTLTLLAADLHRAVRNACNHC